VAALGAKPAANRLLPKAGLLWDGPGAADAPEYWRKGTAVTLVLWIVSLAAHLGSDDLISHSSALRGWPGRAGTRS
jgi:hypothetical protein